MGNPLPVAVQEPVEPLPHVVRDERVILARSQIATLKRGQNIKYLPFAFTEHGAIMAANVLNSPQAVRMSAYVVRAFVKMRSALSDTRQLALKLAELEKEIKSRLDLHETAIVEVLQRLMNLLDPPPEPEPKRTQIGFRAQGDETES
ncbi:MAG: ORF6N domain-containing protein [Planctomycetes bacterium]|nr:ORF6N domain-containing protein [Planctomycetota bacterium]